MTTTEPNAGEQKRGRHAKTNDPEREADPTAADRDPVHADEAADDGPEEATSAETAEASHDEPEDEPKDDEPDDAAAGESDEAEHDEPEDDAPRAEEQPTEEAPPPPPPAAAERREEPAEAPKPKHAWHAVAHHPAGSSLLTASGLVTGLALAPLLFDQLNFEVAARAADAARSAAAPWPAGGEPWFWPGWVAMVALVAGVAVLVVAAIGVRVPDLAVLVAAGVLAVTTARAAWATFAVINAHLWELIPVCIVCVFAFGSAVAAVFRWRSGESATSGSGAGEVAGVTIGAWLLVALLFLGGSAIASSAQTHAFGNVTAPPQDLAGLLSVRAADAPQVDDLRGTWVPQLAAAPVTDDATASAYAVAHNGLTTQFPALLARADDIGASDLGDTWWVSLAAQPFGSQQQAAAWCATSGDANCTPRKVAG